MKFSFAQLAFGDFRIDEKEQESLRTAAEFGSKVAHSMH